MDISFFTIRVDLLLFFKLFYIYFGEKVATEPLIRMLTL